jgi:type VI secretion system protein ImpL
VISLYELDYINAWESLLNDLQFVRFSTVPQMSEALRTLAAPTSPLKNLLELVIANTALVEMPKSVGPAGPFGKAKQTADEIVKAFKKATGSTSVQAGTVVTARFQSIHRLVAGDPGKTPIDEILATINEIQKYLESLGPDPAGVDPAAILASPEMRARQQLLQQQAAALPPGLRQLVAAVGEGVKHVVVSATTSEVEQKYRREVVAACSSYIENRYPFTNDSRAPDVTLADFGKVFGYEGVFDRFFSENLEKWVDTSGGTWTFRPDSVTASSLSPDHFRQAQVIREMFFAKGSQTPALDFVVTLRNLDPAASRVLLEIDGQKRELKRGSPPMRSEVKWPGGGSGQALATFESDFVPQTSQLFSGSWAWFKMIDKFAGPADSEARSIVLDVASSHHRVQVVVDAATAVRNPFASKDWRQFSCGPS